MGGTDYHKVPDTPVAYASAEAVPAAHASVPPTVSEIPGQAPHCAKAGGGATEGPTVCEAAGGPSFGRKPAQVGHCPHCNTLHTRTRTRTFPHWKTWIAVGALAVVFWPLCWLPLVIDEMKQTDHFCVSCGAKLAEIGPFEDCCVTTSE